MFIVSQDKKEIINTENVTRIAIDFDENEKDKKYLIGIDTSDGGCWDLGYYETEERAKQVLQNIFVYKGLFELYKYSDRNTKKEMEYEFAKDDVVFDTYEMPEE